MNYSETPRASIRVEETFHYRVELGIMSQAVWQDAQGTVRVKVPYDGVRLKGISAAQAKYRLGELQLTLPGSAQTPLAIPVEVPVGSRLLDYIKSGQRVAIGAEYDIAQPIDTLVTVEAEVFDRDEKELAISAPDPFRNPLHLRISLWVPDLWSLVKTEESHELEVLLMQGEDQGRVLMPYAALSADNGKVLVQNLAALANSAGGVIFIGVEKGNDIRGLPDSTPATKRQVEAALLQAVLRCVPPVRVAPPHYVELSGGKVIGRLDVPPAGPTPHALDGVIYRREGRQNTEERVGVAAPALRGIEAQGVANFEDMTDSEGKTRFRSTADVVVRSAASGVDSLQLGRDICGLLNSAQGQGRIVIQELPAAGTGQLLPVGRPPALQQIETHIRREVEHLLPQPTLAAVQLMQVDGHPVAVLAVPKSTAPVALYDGDAYRWADTSLQKMEFAEAFWRYLSYAGYAEADVPSGEPVRLLQGKLLRPICPPEAIEPDGEGASIGAEGLRGDRVRVNSAIYHESSLHAQVWEPCAFQRQPKTGGYALDLVVPLRHIGLVLGKDGAIKMQEPSAVAEGEIVIALDGLLASGTQVARLAASASADDGRDAWLNALPILKTSYLKLGFVARLDDLFRVRTKTSFLGFHVPDVALDSERVDDLIQACADLGFRVYDVNRPQIASGEIPARARATFRGIRSGGFSDIFLLLEVTCECTALSRQLRYEAQRVDTRQTYTAVLHVRAALWGTGDIVSQEITRLQTGLYETINRRLLYLRTE